MKWMHRISGIVVALCLLSVAQSAQAALKYSRVSAGWSTNSTWSTAGCGGAANTTAPGAADDVTICTGHAITTNQNSSALSLVIQTGGTLTQATNRSLTIGIGGLNVAGTLTSRNTLTVNGTTSVSGTFQVTSTAGTKTLVGAVTINPGGIWNCTANEPFTLRGGLTHNGATFTSGTGAYVFQTNSQAIGGSSPVTFSGGVTVSGAITLTNNNTGGVTIAGTLAGTVAGSTWVNAANSTLNYGGTAAPMATGVLNAAAVPNTVNYTGAAQTAKVTTYHNLTLSGSGAKTFATTPTVNGVLSMEGTATVVVTTGVVTYGPAATLQYNTATARTVTSEEWVTPFAATGGIVIANTGAITLDSAKVLNASVPLTINSGATLANGAFALSVAGDFTQNGTFTAGAGVFTLNGGAAVQTLSGTGPLGFANLTVNNTGGITLARNVTVTSAIIGAVTLTNTCPTDYTLTSNGGATVAHSCPVPVTVTSINTASANPTSAATVSWTVTFSTSVTGVDATAFALAASGVSGAYIISVTGSGTTWTVTANTGIGAGTLGLNQTGPGVVVPTLTGTFTGQVYTVTSTPALAEYRMDEAVWNGTANEAIDSGTGGFNGTAAGLVTLPTTSNTSPAIAGSPGTCRYGVFNRSNKDYLALPAGFPNLAAAAGDFTITAWINVTDNTLPGQRIFIDDQNNSSPGGWGFSVGETAAFGAGGLRFYYRQPTVYILDTVAIPSNQWLFVALSVQLAAGANASSATIYAWNTAGTLVTSNTGTFTWTAGSDPGPSSIGGETNASPTEGTNAFGFGGNLDEIRVYQKALSQAALMAIAAQQRSCITAPDHFEIQSTGTGVTCTPSTLTLVACADAPCNPYTLGVSGTLSASGTPTVNWDGTTGGAAGAGFVIPIGSSSVTKDVQVTTPGSVVFGVASATPTPTNPATCNFGLPSCTFTAADAGFLMSAPGHVAETASTLTVQAVKKADNSLACVPAFANTAKTVNLKCSYVNPASGTLPARVGGAALNAANNTTAACDGSGGDISLSFDASGTATPLLQYADVGQVQIDASYAGAGLEAGLSMTGAATFIAAPASFALTADVGPVKAGNPFSATVTARNALDNATPNFGKESAAEGVTLGHVLAMGAGSWIDPALGGTTTIPGASFTGGAATASDLTWPEAGQITLNAALASGSYLGSGLTASGTSATDTVSIPDHYDTEILSASGVPMGCGSGLTCPANLLGASGMVYSEQPFGVKVYARTLSGATTANYHDAYAQDVTLSGVGGSGTLSNPLLSAAVFVTSGADAGTATTALSPAYSFGGVTETVPTDISMHAQGSGVSAAIASSGSGESGLKVVSGRAKFGNAYGSEKIPLTVPLGAQFWDGTDWLDSTTDNASQINTALSTAGGNLVVSGLAVTVNSPGVKTLIGGILSGLVLDAPGVPGVANLTLNGPAWLTQVPVVDGQVTFGVYQGNRSIIYQREAY